MEPLHALASTYACYRLHPNAVAEVWEDVERCESDRPPKYIGCMICGEMYRADWEDIE